MSSLQLPPYPDRVGTLFSDLLQFKGQLKTTAVIAFRSSGNPEFRYQQAIVRLRYIHKSGSLWAA